MIINPNNSPYGGSGNPVTYSSGLPSVSTAHKIFIQLVVALAALYFLVMWAGENPEAGKYIFYIMILLAIAAGINYFQTKGTVGSIL